MFETIIFYCEGTNSYAFLIFLFRCELSECAAMYAIASASYEVPEMPETQSKNAADFYNQCMIR